MKSKKQRNHEYYIKHREEILKKQQNSEEIKKYQKEYHLKYKEIKVVDREKHRVRAETQRKYGNLPSGINYHHTTIPYNPDNWIGMYEDEHYKIHRRW